MLPSIEHHVEWVSGLIEAADNKGARSVVANHDAEDEWVEHVNEIAGRTLYPTCNSWYLGANVPGKPRVFMPYPGFPPYVAKCTEIARNGYTGFTFALAAEARKPGRHGIGPL